MADTTIVEPIGGKSKEEVAHMLFRHICSVEDKSLGRRVNGVEYSGDRLATRDYILSTYAECLRVVKGHSR